MEQVEVAHHLHLLEVVEAALPNQVIPMMLVKVVMEQYQHFQAHQ
jgi:hypothetical protein